MSKVANEYYQVHPTKIIEKGYNPKQNQVSESIFSLGNEYMGIRGTLEEGVTAPSLQGAYFNGIYAYAKDKQAPSYKGVVTNTHFMVNAVNWLFTKIIIDGEILDAASAKSSEFTRTLHLNSGVLSRTLVFQTGENKRVKVSFDRFISMNDIHYAYQTITFESLDADVAIKCEIGLDFNTRHWGKLGFFKTFIQKIEGQQAIILGETINTDQSVLSGYRLFISVPCDITESKHANYVGHLCMISLKQGEKIKLEKRITNLVDKQFTSNTSNLIQRHQELMLKQPAFHKQLKKQKQYWDHVFQTRDIKIKGDPKNQQGIRYCIFQLQQTYQGIDPTHNIGAKGLTGESYSGHAFWDTETYCLPFFLFNNPKAAKNLLMFRYHTLNEAKQRAKELDCKGAFYPIATLNGNEGSTLWQHSNLQLQSSSAVAYAIWHYVKITNDQDFLFSYGFEMLIEISRFFVSRGQWNNQGTKFGYYGVMGPDEFQMMVHHNAYTNFMAKQLLSYTAAVYQDYLKHFPKDEAGILKKCHFQESEGTLFKQLVNAMYIPYDKDTHIFEQHEGFFDLPHVDIKAIPFEEFPLYHHWSYDRLYRNNMIKQPDVLMFMFLYSQQFSIGQKKANYAYYEPKTIHESSLSPSIHSIFASELGLEQEALDYFGYATRMDLDDYNRNTNEGLHTTSIAAAWMNIIYGFGGLRSDGETLVLAPSIPKIWDAYSFKLMYQDRVMDMTVYQDKVIITLQGEPLIINLYQKQTRVHGTLVVERSRLS